MKAFGIKVTTVNPGATMSDSWSGSQIDPSRILEAKDIEELKLLNNIDITPILTYDVGYTDIFAGNWYNIATDVWSGVTVPPELAELINTFYVMTIQAIIVDKQNINYNIRKLAKVLAKRQENFKSVFMDMIIRKALAKLIDFIDTSGAAIITGETEAIIKNIINADVNAENAVILKDYKAVRTILYSNSTLNLADELLVDLANGTQWYEPNIVDATNGGFLWTYNAGTWTSVDIADPGNIAVSRVESLKTILDTL